MSRKQSLADDLDYMHARMYSPMTARFLSVDQGSGRPESGHSWNRYAYVRGNPLAAIDPNGLEEVLIFKTDRNPRRDPENPWREASEQQMDYWSKELNGKYDSLTIKSFDVDRVSQVNDALSKGDKVVMVVFIGHAGDYGIFVGHGDRRDTNISSGGHRNDVNPTKLNWSNIKVDKSLPFQISILGCKTGKGPSPVAQAIANAAGVPVQAATGKVNFPFHGRPTIYLWNPGTWRIFKPTDPPPPKT